VLQEKEFERVGSSDTISVDVRILASSNRDLEQSVEKGEFRQDLYYRLNVIAIELPPLRERKSDIPALAKHFLERYRREEGVRVKDISEQALEALTRYDWPGNVRELANIMERLIVLGREEIISAEQVENALPKSAARFFPATASAAASGGDGTGAASAAYTPRQLDEVERDFVVATLKHFGGARAKSAEALGISERSLRDRLKRWQEAGLIDDI
ncbi:MAG: sigma 54-interacting transcriptional regulator, partial [Planctomycetes bacterium]|nr:sigma 54-interacting transcriptional regulator [Planctomycetota bacterium]